MQKQLLIRKLQFMEEEFTFFEYNMNSAKVLFKSNKLNPPINKEAPATTTWSYSILIDDTNVLIKISDAFWVIKIWLAVELAPLHRKSSL